MSAIGATVQDTQTSTMEIDKQHHFATKTTQAVGKINMGFLHTLISPELRSKTVPAFVATYITPAQTGISELTSELINSSIKSWKWSIQRSNSTLPT